MATVVSSVSAVSNPYHRCFGSSLSTVAYVQSWRLSLAVSCIFPCLAITGTIWSIFEQKWQKKTLDQIARGGSLAEEVISTVRTTQAFGAQQKLAAIYNQYIASATKYTMKQCIMLAGGTSIFYFVVYAAYGVSFGWSSYNIHTDVPNSWLSTLALPYSSRTKVRLALFSRERFN